jgi:hypothetical protein
MEGNLITEQQAIERLKNANFAASIGVKAKL